MWCVNLAWLLLCRHLALLEGLSHLTTVVRPPLGHLQLAMHVGCLLHHLASAPRSMLDSMEKTALGTFDPSTEGAAGKEAGCFLVFGMIFLLGVL